MFKMSNKTLRICADIRVLSFLKIPGMISLNKKAPFIWVLQEFIELLRNTYFKDHHSVAASKLSVLKRILKLREKSMTGELFIFHIKHKTT